MQAIWTAVFYQPIYNALIFLIDSVTFGDVGFAIILLTIIVKLALFPISKKSIKGQLLMKKMQPLISEIKEKYPNKEEQARKTFELYKENKVNPFSGCLLLIIQLPIIFALYYAFYKGLAVGDTGLLYSFISSPEYLNPIFLGLFDVHHNSLILAILSGVSQFIHGYYASPINGNPKKDPEKKRTFQEQMSESMSFNMKYVLPVFIVFIAYRLSAAVAIYWITSNIFTVIQELYIRKKLEKNLDNAVKTI
jgi:YidC/Oxa1 family membrane protein insertase